MASPAVVVQSAYKFYGGATDPKRKVVLDQLDMRVDRGSIYGLLGASGCGKTTLLSCIVGRRKLNGGAVWVLGGPPGEPGSGVPGHRIGYMPQDIALVPEFKVKDAVFYFGRICGMSQALMEERLEFLSELLELPPNERLLKNLSGGQQRRVSFAVALVHQPELLILDEPTVGLDPVLREKIWNFLVDLVKDGTSVIITTHYIEETKQASKIGLMRGGKLLAEESPGEVVRRYNTQTLEEAFLILSIKQSNAHQQQLQGEPSSSNEFEKTKPTGISNTGFSDSQDDLVKNAVRSVNTLPVHELTQAYERKHPASQRVGASSATRYKAILFKTLQQFARHPGGLIFSTIFPIVQIMAFFLAVGHDPRSVDIGVINKEAANSPHGVNICSNTSLHYVLMNDGECQFNMISCKFENLVESMTPLKLVAYTTLESALEATRRGLIQGTVLIPRNFSLELRQRLRGPLDVDLVPAASSIAIRLDMTNHQISHFVKKTFYDIYEVFSSSLMHDCGMSERSISTPVAFYEPIYGETNPNYTNFMAPGIMITILFFLATLVTSTLMITDRLEGVWDRNIVAGVKPGEILFVHIFIQSLVIALQVHYIPFLVIILQTVELLLVAFAAYDIPYKGDLVTIASMLFLQGLSGMCYGFLISVCCSSYSQAFYIATGSFYPMILLCGIMWPLEGMSKGLRMIAMMLPFTVPSLSMRDMIEKGFSIVRQEVYIGFAVTTVWITAMVILCILVLKYRKN